MPWQFPRGVRHVPFKTEDTFRLLTLITLSKKRYLSLGTRRMRDKIRELTGTIGSTFLSIYFLHPGTCTGRAGRF